MIYRVLKVTTKSPDWKILDVIEGTENGQSFTDVSINRNDKKTGAVAFPNFDQIVLGYTFEANPWTNAEGKLYLFGPKPKAAPRSAPANIAKAQEVKAENIEKAQDRKNDAITLSAAQRDAVLMVTTFDRNDPFPTDAELKAKIIAWREWFLKEHANRSSQPF